MYAPVVVLDQEGAQARLERRQGQAGRRGLCGACRCVARERAEEELVDGEEEALDAAAAARFARLREDEHHLQVRAHLFEVLRGEVTAVVGVESAGNAAHLPA